MGVEFKRRKEIEILLKLRGNGKIKVVEGLRQVGKSYLLKTLFARELLNLDVAEDRIEILDFVGKDDGIRDGAELKAKVRAILRDREISYLFMDEIQLVGHYGDALKTLHAQNPGIDIYVTGSNSKTLSKDIQREIGAESCSEIRVRPLTYEEAREDYPSFYFGEYFSWGGIPKVVLARDDEARYDAFDSLYRDTYEKDILGRTSDLKNIGENEKRKILQRVFDTVTTGVSLKAITKEINEDNRAENKDSTAIHADLDTYFQRLADSFLFEVMEEDSGEAKEGSKRRIESRGKCYCEDHGLLRYASRGKDLDSAVFENLVFAHLLSQGYEPVSLKFDYFDPIIGEECKNRGIDFFFEKGGVAHLVQAVLVLYGGNSYQREVHNLRFAKKEGRKIVVFYMDKTDEHPDSEGVEFMQIEDFLRSF